MIRILHLLESEADFQTRRSAETLARELGPDFAVETRRIGRGGEWRSAPAAIIALRRMGQFDLVHAWGTRPLLAAAMARPWRLAYSPADPPSSATVGWARAIVGYRDVHVIVPTRTMHRALVMRGLPIERCHLIRPGVDFSRIRRRRDPELRRLLGLDDHDYVLLATGESTPAAGHRDAVWTTSILHELDPGYKLLLWGRGPETGDAMTFAQRLGNPRLLRMAERRLGRSVEFEALLPAADMVLVTATGAVPTLPISIAMAAALPIVASVTYTASELLEDHHTALMAPKRSPRLLAQRVLQLREDANLQWRLSDMARTEAFDYFAQTRFIEQYRAVYAQLARGEPVEVPHRGPGAGLRFHGRA